MVIPERKYGIENVCQVIAVLKWESEIGDDITLVTRILCETQKE